MSASLPQHLYDRAEILRRAHSLHEVAGILHLHPSAIYRMRDRGWKVVKKLRPVPSDWAIQAKYMSLRELAKHYHASTSTVARWMNEKPARPPMKPGPRARQ